MTRLLLVSLVLVLSACENPPTVTIPLSQCGLEPTGLKRQRHQAAYYTYITATDGHGNVTSRTPIYHPPRDWVEYEWRRTCRETFWNTTSTSVEAGGKS